MFRLSINKDCDVATALNFFRPLDYFTNLANHNFWRRRLRVGEQVTLNNLRLLLDGVSLSSEAPDSCFWRPTKSAYSSKSFLELLVHPVQDDQKNCFHSCWNSLATPRVHFFSWLLLHR